MKYVIGIDTGTTGVKAKIYDLTGVIIAEAYSEYGCSYPRPGWVDQDINMLSRANDDVLSRVMRTSGVDSADILSIGMSTQRALHLYVDENGTVLRNGMGISWQDTRCEEQVEWIKSTIGWDSYYATTGLPPSTVWAAPAIRWVQENEPEVYDAAAKIITTQEYFLYQLGARDAWYQDYSNGSLFGLMNIETFDWDEGLLEAFGISRDKLPTLVPSGIQVGTIDADAARRTGLREGTPICTGGGDQQCAAIGAGVIEEGLAEVTLGTAGVSIAHLDAPRYDPKHLISCSASAAAGERKWISEGLQAAAASSYRWYRDTIGYVGKEVESLGGTNAYDVLNGLVSRVPAGAGGLLYLPYLAGSVAPNFESNARGAFIGLTFAHDTAAMARAVMEGVSFETRDILSSFTDMGVELREIRLSGGATKSPIWCQIQTDIYGRPTVSLEEGECTVLGAAILGAVGAGAFDTMAEGIDAMVRVKSTFEPDDSKRELYDEAFGLFKDSYRALAGSGVYPRLASFQARYPN
jgi:xylulokinase